ncbi:hypothetical protein OQJ18_01115 [Fluoribacter dumoffii]|uniref:Uncharacterized protein n=1 Tax=Fluoribacter dumoffii TaxID=463 RepID=A0A377GCJ8_9GAMM|nr:hypothetical protein [Fluoribacter dumoffii]KTC90551.1 hypothetical protein Ldum_1619 [Fluoribacter dumoffii NY 23]MCW8386231.1 hypothetical protein [Fluoribacter dumoffii]MCW8419282.1 hypothetical protein [Fluoribacter dumoffii]MCW8452843.1 hypothetical protein [Fluoribacter dumoffii]MCW8459907.1 hypothetical protein [Fluoribacter dumoffii]
MAVCCFSGELILSTFFSATSIAASAIYAEFKLYPYYNAGFHLHALTSFCCHIGRALYDLSAFLLRVLITPFCLLNPFSWPSLPGHTLNLIDDLVGFALSVVSIAIHPVIFAVRTLTSMLIGYHEGTDYDWGDDTEDKDLDMAMTMC